MNKYKYHKNQILETKCGHSVKVTNRCKCLDGTILYQLMYRSGHIGKQWIFEDMLSTLKFI